LHAALQARGNAPPTTARHAEERTRGYRGDVRISPGVAAPEANGVEVFAGAGPYSVGCVARIAVDLKIGSRGGSKRPKLVLPIGARETELRYNGSPFAAGADVAMDTDYMIRALLRTMLHSPTSTEVLPLCDRLSLSQDHYGYENDPTKHVHASHRPSMRKVQISASLNQRRLNLYFPSGLPC
jgi:hypothetical protein